MFLKSMLFLRVGKSSIPMGIDDRLAVDPPVSQCVDDLGDPIEWCAPIAITAPRLVSRSP
jgi:hypothetical protein